MNARMLALLRRRARPIALGAFVLALVLVGGVVLNRVMRPEPPKVDIAEPLPDGSDFERLGPLSSVEESPTPTPVATDESAPFANEEPPQEPPEKLEIPKISPEGQPESTVISSNGRYVAFSTWTPPDEPGLPGKAGPIFVYDRKTEKTEIVSLSSTNEILGAGPGGLDISADGRFVAFGASPSGNIYIRDRLENTTTLVSETVSGKRVSGTTSTQSPLSLSHNGRFVAFSSTASNLVPGDTNDESDVFVRDVADGRTTRVSVSTSGVQGSGHSGVISGDGRFVAFQSQATTLVSKEIPRCGDFVCDQIYIHDRVSGDTSLASISSEGKPANDWCRSATISDDGRSVVFESPATNLDADPEADGDLFIHDRASDAIVELKLGEGQGWKPTISGDGAMISHFGSHWELRVHDVGTGENRNFDRNWGSETGDFSGDHRFLALVYSPYGGRFARLVVIDLETTQEEIIYE